MSEHALIAPSSLDLTVKCPFSVKAQRETPPLPETEEEAEGTFAHWVALRYAAGHGRVEFPANTRTEFRGRTWTVDVDMVAGAEMYATAVGGFHSTLRLEDPVTIKRVHETQCWGTPDAWRFVPDARELHKTCPPEMSPDLFNAGKLKLLRVVDYKYGHRYVEVFGNYQMVAYATGVMDRLSLDDLDMNLWVELIIVQPRCYQVEGTVRVWRIQAHMLRAYLNIAHSKAAQALSDFPTATTNDSCIDCKAKHRCKTLNTATDAFIDFSTQGELVDMPAEAIGTKLAMVQDAIARLEAQEAGLQAHAESYLRQGKPVAFYHMKPGRSNLTYFDDVNVDELVSMGDLFNINLRKPQTRKDSIVTPTQAIQMGIDDTTMRSYAHRPPAALKLARDNSVTAKKVFNATTPNKT